MTPKRYTQSKFTEAKILVAKLVYNKYYDKAYNHRHLISLLLESDQVAIYNQIIGMLLIIDVLRRQIK